MIETLVGQPYGHDLDVEITRYFLVCLDLRAKTVAGPQPGATAIDQAVSGTFETDAFVEIEEVIAIFAKPVFEIRLFRPPFMRHEMACDRFIAVDDAGIGRKHHVRQVRLWLDGRDLRELADRVAQLFPLLPGTVEAQRLVLAGHPRVDHVVDREKVGRTHQYLVFRHCIDTPLSGSALFRVFLL